MKRMGMKSSQKHRLGSSQVLTKEKIHAEDSLRWVGSQLKDKLLENLNAFPSPSAFHPLDRDIIDLTDFDEKNNSSYIERIKNARKLIPKVDDIIKFKIDNEIKVAGTPHEANLLFQDGKDELRRLLFAPRGQSLGGETTPEFQARGDGGNVWDELCTMAILLRGLPVFELDVPTISLVGAPNVGKSSLVRALSSGKPEVNHYPFTTRGILIGHLTDSQELSRVGADSIEATDAATGIEETGAIQVIDTPGILYRPDQERNNIEKLTLAVLDHSSSTIAFVMDFSGFGIPIEDQVNMRNELKEKYCGSDEAGESRRWVDVVSKCDITEESIVSKVQHEMLVDCSSIFRTSTVDLQGINDLQGEFLRENRYFWA
jgi:nucleolar GTP-binding protein